MVPDAIASAIHRAIFLTILPIWIIFLAIAKILHLIIKTELLSRIIRISPAHSLVNFSFCFIFSNATSHSHQKAFFTRNIAAVTNKPINTIPYGADSFIGARTASHFIARGTSLFIRNILDSAAIAIGAVLYRTDGLAATDDFDFLSIRRSLGFARVFTFTHARNAIRKASNDAIAADNFYARLIFKRSRKAETSGTLDGIKVHPLFVTANVGGFRRSLVNKLAFILGIACNFTDFIDAFKTLDCILRYHVVAASKQSECTGDYSATAEKFMHTFHNLSSRRY